MGEIEPGGHVSGQVKVAAPGKITLFGEYGVRVGGPVLVAAIDRYVRATVDVTGGSGITFESPADGITLTTLSDTAPESRLALFVSALNSTQGYLESRACTLDGLHLALRTDDMKEGDVHLGLGSSGATAVAIAAALFGHAGLEIDSPSRRWDLLTLAAHTQSVAVGPQASGSDVAAAVFGGLTVYRRGGAVRPTPLPEGLRWAAIRTEGDARTGSMLFRVPGDSGRGAADLDVLLRDVARSAERAVERLEASTDRFLESLREFREVVTLLGEETGALTLSPRMQAVIDSVADLPVVAKPTPTTGDGDLGLLFTDDADALALALDACAKLGYRKLEASFEPTGVHLVQP